jgi:UDP-glucose 4-epimerase
VSEDSVPQPATPYGWSKLMTERMLDDVAGSYPFNYCALRYFNVAGDERGSARLTSSRSLWKWRSASDRK